MQIQNEDNQITISLAYVRKQLTFKMLDILQSCR